MSQRNTTLSERITKTKDGMRAWQQERVIFEATERICELMEESGIERAQLAKILGKTKGYISQLLDGSTNMTLRTLSDTFLALNRAVHIHDEPISVKNNGTAGIRYVFNEDEKTIWGEFPEAVESEVRFSLRSK